MNFSPEQIEQIVQSVLKQVQQRRAADSPSAPVEKSAGRLISGRIITAELLAEAGVKGEEVQFEPKAIVTPAARDYLKEHRIQAQKSKANTTQPAKKSCPVFTTAELSTAVESELKSWSNVKSADLSQAIETIDHEFNRGGMHSAVLITDKPGLAACEVNRSGKVRGVAVRRVADIDLLAEVNANVICLPNRGLSFMEHRNLLRAVTTHLATVSEGRD